MSAAHDSAALTPTRRYRAVYDGEGEITFEAADATAALAYAVEGLSYTDYEVEDPDPEDDDFSGYSVYVHVAVYEIDEDGEDLDDEPTITDVVELEPPTPTCEGLDGAAHDEHTWRAPIELVGGIRDNPGTFSSGGGVLVRRVCAVCGTYSEYDSWATSPEDGSITERLTYQDADEASLAWVRSHAAPCSA